MQYTAIIGRNFRDMSGSPKVLLREVLDTDGNVFRNHCWVDLTADIKKILPKNNRHKTIQFTAKVKEYKDHMTGNVKNTLSRINSIATV